ncbi:hypothetical protein [Actinacidiphila soli]|uniref:hypothetical protein n=1 Tax=Actinacidiphila soli TaxID=2487275 RepID=UPI000FCBEF97|nr:hypothetical protein [Actinacidiphila soli]
MWNKQRKQEVLLNVEDVALGYQTQMKWNGSDTWVWSKETVHPPLIDIARFWRAQELMSTRAARTGMKERQSRHHDYQLQGLVTCGLCRRRIGTQWSHDEAYYRCRFALQYALANKVDHPRNVLFRERDVVPKLDEWISLQFAPCRKAATINQMYEAQTVCAGAADAATAAIVRDCDGKLTRYRALIDSGAADSETVAQWIAETEARRATAAAQLRTRKPRVLSRERIGRARGRGGRRRGCAP